MNKTVLIVDPFSTGILYAPYFKRNGVDCIALISSKDVPEHFTKYLSKDDFSQVIYWDESVLASMKALDVCAVVAGCETGVYLTDYLTDALGVKGNSIASTTARRHKYDMQLALKNAGLAHIHSDFLTDRSQIDDFVPALDEKKFYVVKPVNSAATEGVVFAQGREEVRAALKNSAWNKVNDLGEVNLGFIVQNFISGPEYIVDMVAFGSTYIVAAICKCHKITLNGSKFVYGALETINPSSPTMAPLVDYARKAAAALDIEVGPIHMELIWADDGPVMIETGARLHGGGAAYLFESAYQPTLVDLSVSSYLGTEYYANDNQTVNMVAYGKLCFFYSESKSTFQPPAESNIAQAKQIPAYKGHKYFVSSGDTLPLTVDLMTCPGFYWISHPHKSVLEQGETAIRSLLWNA